jgi:hypothetical protein
MHVFFAPPPCMGDIPSTAIPCCEGPSEKGSIWPLLNRPHPCTEAFAFVPALRKEGCMHNRIAVDAYPMEGSKGGMVLWLGAQEPA